jgi:hypothetical protein
MASYQQYVAVRIKRLFENVTKMLRLYANF